MLIELAVSAAFGGLITVGLSHWLSRAKATLHDFSVNVECPQLTHSMQSEVAAQELYKKRGKDFCFPSEELITLLDDHHDYLSSPHRVYRHYQEYTSYLYTTINESAKLESELSRMKDSMNSVYNLYKHGRLKEAFIELSNTGEMWWPPRFG